ncbi:beta-cubebene synthase-like isoform X1 [Tasmannia lanceolata]|uniref:beta-cubebene synthase-like isoform X1 n=1 Tax=Tasmannia lanceolata TaxID=3420 RepID=UPI0040638146
MDLVPATSYLVLTSIHRKMRSHNSILNQKCITQAFGVITSSPTHDQMKLDGWTKRIEELKEEVKRMLSSAKGSQQEIDLIDVLQRLGVAYHFEMEINEALHQLYESHTYATDDDLYVVALRFQLLRQHGFNVSSGIPTYYRYQQKRYTRMRYTRPTYRYLRLPHDSVEREKKELRVFFEGQRIYS